MMGPSADDGLQVHQQGLKNKDASVKKLKPPGGNQQKKTLEVGALREVQKRTTKGRNNRASSQYESSFAAIQPHLAQPQAGQADITY